MSAVMSTAVRHPIIRIRFLLLRRISQLSILMLFLLGPWYGIWFVKGNLSFSLTLDTLPLTDPFVLMQTVFAGHMPEQKALIGVALVVGFYLLVGGRFFCSWVCPVNLITDLSAWLREKLRFPMRSALSSQLRYWLLGVLLFACALTGTAVWEWLNPVSLFHRGLIFGFGAAWTVLLAVFLFDLLVVSRGWCGHLCPMGAFYSLLGVVRPLRINAVNRSQCDDCMDCFRVCPEPQVIQPALKNGVDDKGTMVSSINCTNCGRCIDVCDQNVFKFSTGFANRMENLP